MSTYEVAGGPTEEESAAIAAVVADVFSREGEVLAAPPPRPRQSDWVRAWMPRVPRLRSTPESPVAPDLPEDE